MVTSMNRTTIVSGIMVIFVVLCFIYSGMGKSLFADQKSKAVGEQTKEAVSKTEQAAEQPVSFSGGVPVLMYHSVGEEANNDAVISVALFKEHMLYLHQNGYQPISLSQLQAYLQGKSGLPAKPVVLTFDDGYRDTYEVVIPILKQYGFKSVLFIPAGDTGQRLSWQEIREIKKSGMEISSHSFHHRELGGLSRAEQLDEVAKSKEVLDRMLGQNTQYFCYPNGSYDDDTFRALREQGFSLAVTTNPGWAKPGDNLLALPRVWMGNGVDLKRFKERLTREDYSIL